MKQGLSLLCARFSFSCHSSSSFYSSALRIRQILISLQRSFAQVLLIWFRFLPFPLPMPFPAPVLPSPHPPAGPFPSRPQAISARSKSSSASSLPIEMLGAWALSHAGLGRRHTSAYPLWHWNNCSGRVSRGSFYLLYVSCLFVLSIFPSFHLSMDRLLRARIARAPETCRNLCQGSARARSHLWLCDSTPLERRDWWSHWHLNLREYTHRCPHLWCYNSLWSASTSLA